MQLHPIRDRAYDVARRSRSARGAVIAEVLYAMSIFSVLSLTAVGNPQLEETFHTNTSPDLHLMLYAGGAGTPHVLGRLNFPTSSRTAPGANDPSVAVQIPALSAGAITGALPAGGTYSVRFGPGLSACCDGGDNACGSVDPAAVVEQGTLTPPMASRVNVADTFRELKFQLTTFEPPATMLFDPKASVDNGLLVKATRVSEFDAVQEQTRAGGYVVCRLQQGQSILATGLMKIEAPIDAGGQSSQLHGGTVHLKYLAPLAGQPGTVH